MFAFRIIDKFGELRWGEIRPEHLDVKNAGILFVSEGGMGGWRKSLRSWNWRARLGLSI